MEVLGCELADNAKKELMLDSSPANASHDMTIRMEQFCVSTSIDLNTGGCEVSEKQQGLPISIYPALMAMALGDT